MRVKLGAVGAVLALVAAGLVVLATPAGAQIPADSAVDDGDPGSLRDAIDDANAAGEDSVIELDGGTYTLDECGGGTDEDGNVGGDLDYFADDDLVIEGNGSTIEQTCPGERVLHHLGVGTVTLRNVTLTGGTPGGDGGGVLAEDGGDLVVENSLVTGNHTGDDGGGITIEDGDLEVRDSTISDNTAEDGGGGIRVEGDATVFVLRSTISGNESEGDGGGVDLRPGTSGVFVETLFQGNDGGDDSGAIDIAEGAEALVDKSLFVGNTAGEDGGAIENDGMLTVWNSTFSGNTSVRGGAIGHNPTGPRPGVVTSLANVTITDNTTTRPSSAAVHHEPNPEGGDVSVQVVNTIIAGNEGGDCVSAPGVFESLGHNIDGDGSCDLGADGDQPETDPVLGPLADNGGFTQTHLPLTGSPAIDTGDNEECMGDGGDQRRFPRPVDGTGDGVVVCDIGAVEVQLDDEDDTGEAVPATPATPATPTVPTTPAATAVTAAPSFTG